MHYSEDLSKLSEDSYDVIFELGNSKDQAARNNKHDYTARSSRATEDEKPYSIRSSIDVPDVNQESMLMSHKQHPPVQAMNRSFAAYVHERSSSSVFTANSTPPEWSLVSNESLFSLQEDHVSFDNRDLVMGHISTSESSDFSLSEEVMSDRPSTQPETARSAFDGDVEEAGPPISDNSSREFIVQNTHDHNDHEKACNSEVHCGSRKSKTKIEPLPSLVIKKPEKLASGCTTWSCCLPSRSGLSTCSFTTGFSNKMPDCSCCCNSSFGWRYDWNCCCSCFPKGSGCQNRNSFCWNWRCWRLFHCWHWNCCYKGSFSRSCSCCPCSSSWNCCSKRSWCESWRCSTGTCRCSRNSCL